MRKRDFEPVPNSADGNDKQIVQKRRKDGAHHAHELWPTATVYFEGTRCRQVFPLEAHEETTCPITHRVFAGKSAYSALAIAL